MRLDEPRFTFSIPSLYSVVTKEELLFIAGLTARDPKILVENIRSVVTCVCR
jgi:hypothetical protein